MLFLVLIKYHHLKIKFYIYYIHLNLFDTSY